MRCAPVTSYRRVALAGWDCRSAAGDADATWRRLAAGTTALVRDPDIGWCGRAGAADLLGLAEAAARRPWASLVDPSWPAFACAASKGDLDALDRALAGDAGALLQAGPSAPTNLLARRLGLRHHLPVPAVAACSTGLTTLLAGADLVERGSASAGLVGAADASLTPLLVAGFRALGVLCGAEPPGQGRGFAPAEGAGFFALAPAGPWRLLAGVRLADAGHETGWRHPEVVAAACAGLWSVCPGPDLIVVHGTGTSAGDAAEGEALAAGPWKDRTRLVCKPVIGHCLGASGAVELAAALEAPVRRLWKLSLGFGGHLAAVAVERA